MAELPLSRLRVVEFTHAVAGPFCGSLLGDFGAEVIKVEQPGVGDSLRRMGPAEVQDLWFTVDGRNKHSVEADLKDPDDLAWVKELVASSDVVIQNYRPGVLDKFGLGWEGIEALNPRTILMDISGFGRGGPYSARPGFGKIAEAFSGATNLTGFADRPPVHPGYALADLVTGVFAAYGIMVAVEERHTSGKGQHIDLAVYDGLFRMLEWQIPYFDKLGRDITRAGTQFPFEGGFITEICTAADGRDVVLSAATEVTIKRVIDFLRGEGLYDAEGIDAAAASRGLTTWVGRRPADEAIEQLHSVNVVAGLVNHAADLANDPHVSARGDLVDVDTPTYGTVRMPAPVPRFSRTPGKIKWAGPRLGADNGKIDVSFRHHGS